MTDISYKELLERFKQRDDEAIRGLEYSAWKYNNDFDRLYARLEFTEGRLKDICQVVMHLLEKLEDEKNKEEE